MRQEIQEHEDRPRPSIEPCDGSEDADLVADATHEFIDRSRHGRAGRRSESADGGLPLNGFWRDAVWLPCRDGKARPTARGIHPLVMGNSTSVRHRKTKPEPPQKGSEAGCFSSGQSPIEPEGSGSTVREAGAVKSGLQSMADGPAGNMVSDGDSISPNDSPEARVLRLRGYGDAIVAPVAAEFIMAYCSCEQKLCVMRGSEEDDDA